MRAALALLLIVITNAAEAEDAQYLFEALRQRPFHLSYDRLMKEVQPTPDWLVHFNRNFDGASGSMTPTTIDGKPYLMSFVCEPKDCADHKFVVLFEANGGKAYGALGGKDNAPYFYGAPSPAAQEAMAKAVKG